jgi:uncharacterized repeat protein (TIGR01451 family)
MYALAPPPVPDATYVVLPDDVNVGSFHAPHERALSKTLTSPVAGLQAGSTVSYSVVVGNTGTITAFETAISDALPAAPAM